MKKQLFRSAGLALLMVFLFAFNANTYAQHRDRRENARAYKRGVIEHNEYRDIVVKDRHYFYRGGYFYDRRPEGYVKVVAPFGARISILPRGYEVIRVHRHKYFRFGGIFYQFLPREKVYVVVQAPF